MRIDTPYTYRSRLNAFLALGFCPPMAGALADYNRLDLVTTVNGWFPSWP
jgi:hypothetical protein